MRYVVQCICGAKTGCLPCTGKGVIVQPPPPPKAYPGACDPSPLTQDQLKRARTCSQCGRQLDDSRGQYIRAPQRPEQVENLLSVTGASNGLL